MREFLLTICCILFLVACDGGGSSEPLPYPEDSSESMSSAVESSAESSSEMVSSVGESSSSDESSSSETLSNSSSSVASSSISLSSSSSSLPKSSSSIFVLPCKTETEDNCEYGSLIDERDGQTYKTVKIGEQWWMAENLNYAYLQPTAELDSSSWCYNDSAEYCEKFGRLYLWSAAMDSAGLFGDGTKGCGYFSKKESWYRCPNDKNVLGICPEGWHIPSVKEHNTLFYYVKDVHLLLSASGEWFNAPLNTDTFGFALLPAGYYCSMRDPLGESNFDGLYMDGAIWLAAEDGSQSAYTLIGYTAALTSGLDNDELGNFDKYVAQSEIGRAHV